jgi:hypothetical protein
MVIEHEKGTMDCWDSPDVLVERNPHLKHIPVIPMTRRVIPIAILFFEEIFKKLFTAGFIYNRYCFDGAYAQQFITKSSLANIFYGIGLEKRDAVAELRKVLPKYLKINKNHPFVAIFLPDK